MRLPLIISLVAVFAQTASAASLSAITTCQLDEQSQVILREERATDGDKFFLQIDGNVEKAFTDMPDTDFVGTIALATCVDHVRLYVNANAMQLVIPNIGYEVRGKYLVYQYSAETGQPQVPLASDAMPDKRGFKLLNVTAIESKRRQASLPKG